MSLQSARRQPGFPLRPRHRAAGLQLLVCAALIGLGAVTLGSGGFNAATWPWVLFAALIVSVAMVTRISTGTRSRVWDLPHHETFTKLYSSAYFNEVYERTLASTGDEQTLALVLVDIDGLGAINEEYGHEAGDCVIQAVAAQLQALCQGCDIATHLAGGTFALLLERVDESAATRLGEYVRSDIAEHPCELSASRDHIWATVSIGLAVPTGTLPPSSLYTAAREALAASKAVGGNCVSRAPAQSRDEAHSQAA